MRRPEGESRCLLIGSVSRLDQAPKRTRSRGLVILKDVFKPDAVPILLPY